MLLTALERVALLALPTFGGLPSGFGALRRVLPVLSLRIALRASGGDGMGLLFEGIVEPPQEHLVVARGGAGHPGLGADREVAHIAVAVRLEVGQLLFVFGDA